MDLPAELRNRILRRLVCDIGIRKAWLYRDVDRYFRKELENEILSKQPIEAFHKRADRQFVHEILPSILVARLGPPLKQNGFPSTGLEIVSKITDNITLKGGIDGMSRQELLEAVAKELCANYSFTGLCTAPTSL